MGRVAVGLLALFLVNLPFAHQLLTDRELSRSGREVEAALLDSRSVNGRHLVAYRLPRSLDSSGTRFSARVDRQTFDRARETDALAVRVVPGDPATNEPVGEVRSPLFAVVAIGADVVLLVVAGLLWRRWRLRSRHQILAVADGRVTLAGRGPRPALVASAPTPWTDRVHPGERVSGTVHLAAHGDVLPGPPLTGLEQVEGSTYRVHGRVLDARTRRVVLEVDGGLRLPVDTGSHRIRTDLRDSTEVVGTLCFTPSFPSARRP